MKKFMALSMTAVMVLPIIGYGPKPVGTTTADTTAATEAAVDTSAADTMAAESAAGTAASGKKYVIDTDTTFTPFEFENRKGEIMGIDLDTLKAIAQDQGFEYEAIPAEFSVAYIALESEECDGVIAGMSITNERIQKCDLFEPYYDSSVGMAVLFGSNITTYNQLKGQSVAAEIGTEGCTLAGSIVDQYDFEVTQYESSSDMYQAALSGEAATCFEDYPVVGYEISRGPELTPSTDMGKGSSYGFAILKDTSPELAGMFNKGLENIKANGRYEKIPNTYITK